MNATYDQAYFQMAQSHYALKEYRKCIAQCDLALNQKATADGMEANQLTGNVPVCLGRIRIG